MGGGGVARRPGTPPFSLLRMGRRGIGWVLLVGVLGPSGWYGASVWRARARYDTGAPEKARLALEKARRSPALRFAPEAVAEAEDAYRDGMGKLRRQDARFLLLRDYREAVAALELGRVRAMEALEAGQRNQGAQRATAEAVLEEVAAALGMLDELEGRAALSRQQRAGLATARMGFVEATGLFEAGALREAEAKGRAVLSQARKVGEQVGTAVLRFADEDRIQTWRRWIDETVAWSREHSAVALVVVKERNLLLVYRNGKQVQSFDADMGSNNLAQKYRRGDRATPEGKYRVKQVKGRGQTLYYKALLLDYPTREDLKRIEAAKEMGTIPRDAGPGALIEIHGEGGRGTDWTNGCVAVANPDMDALFRLVKVGTPVTIVGGDGSSGSFSSLAERLKRAPEEN